MADVQQRILITGATGYVGGRLVPALLKQGYRLRCLARHPQYLRGRVPDEVEIVAGDVLQADTLAPAMREIDTAFYLIHSMGSDRSFVEQDRIGAENFAAAARQAGVRRIVYLGGLGGDEQLSPHLASRQQVGRILRESGVPTIEFRASAIIGSGSLSFDLVRALVQKLPIMIVPRWVYTAAQPIAIDDVLAYLVAAVKLEGNESVVYEIGGADRLTYAQLMREYAEQSGLRRWMIPVPVLTPWLSSLWLGLVTPVQSRVGRKLIDSLTHETIVRDERALRDFSIRPRGIREAIARALVNEDQEFAATRWSDSLSSAPAPGWGGVRFGTRVVDSRTIEVPCTAEEAFWPIARIGGDNGYYYADWLWRARGFLDRLAGGVGLRRGRRHPAILFPGDALDFWRVEAFEPNQLLRLEAEMKVPGRAWLQYEVLEREGGATIRQTAIFDPRGIAGLAYWYGIWPLHAIVFSGMLRKLAQAAVTQAGRQRAVSAAA